MPLGAAALGVVASMAAGTWLGGWWMVPVVAGVWAWLVPALRPWRIGLLTGCAWAGLLAVQASNPAFAALLDRVGGIFGLPPVVLACLPPLFAGLLGWSAAGVVGRRQLSADGPQSTAVGR